METNLPPYLSTCPSEETEEATIPIVSSDLVHCIPIRILGPVRAWRGEIRIRDAKSLIPIKLLIEQTAKERGCRFPGFFLETGEGSTTTVYHISRYPRRLGLEVPPISEFRANLNHLYRKFSETESVEMKEDLEDKAQLGGTSCCPTSKILRVVLGLREGYFDQRKEDIEAKIADGTFSDLEEVKKIVLHRLGDLTDHGIDLDDKFKDVKDLQVALSKISLSVLHNIETVKRSLGTPATVSPAEIFSVATDYTYSEEAALIEVPADLEHFQKLVQLADSMKQARFTIERPDIGSVVNIEIESFSAKRSAQMI